MDSHHPDSRALTRRRLLGLAGGIAAVGALAACSGEPQPGPTSSTAPTLTHWVHRFAEPQFAPPTSGPRALDRIAAQFSDAQVQVTWKQEGYAQELATALRGGAAPDVFETDAGPSLQQIRSGDLADLTDLLGDARSDVHAEALARVTDEGRVWGVPQLLDARFLIYRRSMLQKAQVAPPRTLEELVAACAALTTDKVKGLHLGSGGVADAVGIPIVRSAGAELLTARGTAGFADPTVAAALALLAVPFAKKQVLLDVPEQWYVTDPFTQGLVAMQSTGLWTLPAVRQAIGDDVGVLPWPAMAGGRPTVLVNAHTASVSARSPQLELAKRYVRWLWVDNTDAQVELAGSEGLHLPARTSLTTRVEALRSGAAQEVTQLVGTDGYVAPLRWTPACAQALAGAVSDVLVSGASAGRRLETAAATVNAEQARLGS